METKNIDPFYGAIPENPSEEDWQLASGVVDLPNPRHTFFDDKHQYNQGNTNRCTVFGSAGCVSDLTRYKYTPAELQQLWDLSKKYLVRPSSDEKGGYQSTAADVVAKNFTPEQIVYFRIGLISPEADKAFKQGYSLAVLYRGNQDYNLDHYLDGVLDATQLSGLSTYSHELRMTYDKTQDVYYLVVDNYFDPANPTRNTYKISKENLVKLVANNVFYKWAYVFAYKADLRQEGSLISSFAVNSVEKAKKHDILDWGAPQQLVTPQLLEDVLKKLNLLTVDTDKGCTKERLIVALDRANLLN